jgi:predicted phosphodiesterase
MKTRNHDQYVGLIRSEAQNHSRTQQEILNQKEKKPEKLNRIKAFLEVNVWGWFYHYIKSRFGKRHPFMDYSKAGSNGIFEMYCRHENDNNHIRMVLAADWGSYTKESKNIGHLMGKENPDYSIHLGDTYFVGAPDEIYCNFVDSNGGWPKGASGFLALPGNHEFYCNGNPYFDTLLPETYAITSNSLQHQAASYFCLENQYWRVLGLDTGYYSVGRPLIEFIIKPDAHLDDKIIQWLKNEVKLGMDNRGIILLTHHQYCSAFEGKFEKAAEAIKSILPADKKDVKIIWIWGHEHRFAVYGQYQSKNGIKAYGRCIGHGGMPPEIGKIKDGKETYAVPDEEKAKDNNLVFYDVRKKTKIGKSIIGHNGYVVFNFDEARLSIEYKDESTWLFKETWDVNLNDGSISGVSAEVNPNAGLSLFADDYIQAIK